MLGLISGYMRDMKREFSGYGAAAFGQDALAGVTVAAVALPLALAFGVGSGADAASGLISAIVSAFVIGGLSGASFQISGPTGAMTAILIPLSARFGFSGVLAAGFVSGALLILAGLCRAGRLVNLIPAPVITGFTSGIAVIIALGQLESLFGVKSEGTETLGRAYNIFAHGFHPNLYATAVGAVVILLVLLWPKKWASRVPGSLAGIVFGATACSFLRLPVDTVGNIPQTLMHESRLTTGMLVEVLSQPILVAGTSIAALGMVESLLCGIAGGRMKGEKLNVDRELVAQGLGNILLPFLGGVPATAAIARTSVAIKSGCRTRLTGVTQGAALLLSMFLLGPFMSKIPLAALAGVLIVTAWRMNEWRSIRYIFGRKFRWGEAKFLITLSATVVFDLTIAIAAGVFFAVATFVSKVASIEVTVSEIDPVRLHGRSVPTPHTQVVYVTGPMFFAAMGRFEEAVHAAEAKVLIFSMRGVPYIDTSGAQMLWDFCSQKKKESVLVFFSALQPRVKELLFQAGVAELVGRDSFYETALDAIEAASAMRRA
ncbi:MAG: SulP family inorganic anion transporter [Synergistaceae bacterium]|jgi:SulP family sulfate permease|nr:SulP family inorganic anion transporter [Synergistaceae bacterium]